ncbi:hypothetical protein PR002_g26358 [Phytophthora rubi]|uniref:Uncharacterized protein n=1 Tax=Phytophthora rubi TaxID=129364 RepID=A0A6A3HTE6_9STRA|nr:hypothetical protein PR002_g26358 [Phytophthora rubi]
MPPGCRPASLPDLARRRQARRDQQQPQGESCRAAASGSVVEADGGVSTADAKLRLSGRSGEVAAFKPRISSSGSPAAAAAKLVAAFKPRMPSRRSTTAAAVKLVVAAKQGSEAGPAPQQRR